MKIKMFLATFLAFGLGLTIAACDDEDGGGGGTICDDAGDALLDTCPELFEDSGETGGDGGDDTCEGDDEAIAQCVVDNPQGACDVFAADITTEDAMAFLECSQ